MKNAENISQSNLSLFLHIQRTLKLAFPVVLSRLGIIAMVSMDVIVLGRAGSRELADYILATSVFDAFLVFLIGLLMGVPVLTARAIGAEKAGMAGQIWYRGMFQAALFGSLMIVLLQFSESFFLMAGQDPEQSPRAAEIVSILALSLPPIGLFIVCSTFLESINRPFVGTVVVWAGNLGNLVLNIVFVFGWGAIPAMGAAGCAVATILNSGFMALGLILYIRWGLKDRHLFGIIGKLPTLWSGGEEQRKAGYGAGASTGLEAGAFSVLILFVGVLGEIELAVYGVLFQFLALFFMGALGIAVATQIRVGNAWGRNDPHGMKYAGWIGLGLSIVFTGFMSLFLYLLPEKMIGIFTDDQALIVAAAPVLVWVAAAIVFDGGQVVVNHACRGRGDAWVPSALHFASYWLLMLPLSAFCAFSLKLGVAGIYMGVAISAVFSVSVLCLRFATLCRRVK